MKSKTIVFTKPQTAELIEREIGTATGDRVKVKMEYTVVSGGTERACIIGMNNTSQKFPMSLGYCGVGYVTEIGEKVEKIKIGDRVLIADLGNEAEVTALPDKKGMVMVQSGLFKTKVKLENLRLVGEKKTNKPNKTRSVNPRTSESRFDTPAKTECDLRGMNVEEGILEVDRFIDQAMRLGIGEVSIIHGKGTGVLRKGIQEYLRKHPSVKKFRLGTFGEGESGVTIVTIK